MLQVICLALSVKTKRPKIKMILDAQIEKQWTSIFPAEVVNESDCILFLSRMTYIAFAEYLFNRNIVPSGAFVRRRIGGKTGTVFHTFNKSRWGIKLSDMLKGVAEAIKHKYARQAIIMINEDDRDVDLASEVFSVSFAYNGEDCFKITDQHGDTIVSLGYKDKATFRKQVAYIIKKIGKVNEQLVSFGKKITPFIKLTYFDERTPPDYHPMHFKGCKRAFYFDHAPPKFDFGIVSTSYSAMLFEIQSKYITSTSELEEVMMKNAVDEGNQLMDATFDGEMTMADIDQRSTPGDHRSSSFHTGLASAVHAKQDIRNSIEQMRAIEPDLLSPKSPELHHLKDANHSISERSGDNDTTNDDYPSPAQEINGGIKTRKNALKKQIKKKSPVKKRSIAPRKAKKNAMPSQGDLVETTPVSGSSSTTTRGKVSQTRISPPKELDSTPLRNKVLSSTSFKTSVAMRSFLQSPDDISDYGAH